MDKNLVYNKTPAGEEATLQRTRVVQRNLRMVLLQVDGQMDVAGLIEKIGNENLVVNALRELEKGGYIALSMEAPSVWEQSKQKLRSLRKPSSSSSSQSSSFEPSQELPSGHSLPDSNFSSFGKPVLPVLDEQAKSPAVKPVEPPSPAPVKAPPSGPGFGERLSEWLKSLKPERSRELAPLRRVSWGKRIGWAVVLLVAVAVAVGGALFFPFSVYRSDFEAILSATAGTRVQIGDVTATMTPRPAILLHDVRVGEKAELRAGVLRIPGVLMWWRNNERKQLDGVELSGIKLSADFAGQLGRLATGVQNSRHFELARVDLKNVTVEVGSLAVADLAGDIAFASAQTAGSMRLRTADGGLKIEVLPKAEAPSVVVEGINWKASESSPFQFSSLTLKGRLLPGKAVLQQVEMNLLDGVMQGVLTVDWSQGLIVAGEGNLQRVSVRKLANALGTALEMDGRLAGAIQVRGVAKAEQSMLDGLDATLDFQVEQGVMQGVDIGEATRRGPGEIVRGGMTKFDRLKGRLTVSPRQIGITNLEMDSGLVKANGQFVARRDKTVEGSLQVNISTSATSIRAPVKIYGTLPVLNTVVSPR